MNSLGISTDPAMLDVELPRTLIESPSVLNFMPEEEASVCPLLSNTNGTSTPLTFSHPLTPCVDNESNESTNLCNEDTKAETGSTGSSSGIGMEVADTTLFSKHYQHLQHNNGAIIQDANGNATNGGLKLSGDTPSFVSWNWPLIRKCTFFAFMSSLLAMIVVVIAMLIAMPKSCNPKTAWYRGSVFYEVFPASFQDSDNDGVGDLRGISNRVDYFAALSVAAVRLNSIFPTPHYPEDHENVTSLMTIAKVLGTVSDLEQLSATLHAHNISLILDLPIAMIVRELGKSYHDDNENEIAAKKDTNASVAAALMPAAQAQISESLVSHAMRKWTEHGVDGFYVKGLENFVNDNDIVNNLETWKRMIGTERALIVGEAFINQLPNSLRSNALTHIDLVDVHLDVSNGARHMEEKIMSTLSGALSPINVATWIHWNIGGINHERITTHTQHTNFTLAASLMQLMLPGTPSIFYGDEISLQAVEDPQHEHNATLHLHHLPTMKFPKNSLQFTNKQTLPWLPQTGSANLEQIEIIREMIKLRDRSPSIYKNAICKPETSLTNTQIRRSHDDILLVERVYPRRNSFVSVSNFGPRRVTMDMTSMFYSGKKMLDIYENNEKIYFANFEIGPYETIVVKLDK